MVRASSIVVGVFVSERGPFFAFFFGIFCAAREKEIVIFPLIFDEERMGEESRSC